MEVIRKPDPPDAMPLAKTEPPPAPLSAADLGALLCRIKAVRIGTGEAILVIVAAEDWQQWMDDHQLVITRRTP